MRPEHDTENSFKHTTTEPPEVSSTPPDFNGQIVKYTGEDILKMIVSYNDQFGITRSDALSERINKFQSFLSVTERCD